LIPKLDNDEKNDAQYPDEGKEEQIICDHFVFVFLGFIFRSDGNEGKDRRNGQPQSHQRSKLIYQTILSLIGKMQGSNDEQTKPQ
jgi:hypothetical protein